MDDGANLLCDSPVALRLIAGALDCEHLHGDCGWPDAAATGINVIGQPPPLAPQASAVVMDNAVTMSAPEGTAFGANSAGIKIRGFAHGNSVLNNRIRGRARAALAMIDQNGGNPGNSSFVANDLSGFQSSLADIFVDAGVTSTIVIGRQATVEDHGSATKIDLKP